MDRAQPGAIDSGARNYEIGQALGQFSEGWIVDPTTPTIAARRDTNIDETTFDGFDADWSGTSLQVSIGPGEGFADGWFARDTVSERELDANATTVLEVGWDPDAVYSEEIHGDDADVADRVLLDPAADIPPDVPTFPIWEFTTDGDGVTAAVDRRQVGPVVTAGKRTVQTVDDLPDAGDYPLGTEFFVIEENQTYEVTQNE